MAVNRTFGPRIIADLCPSAGPPLHLRLDWGPNSLGLNHEDGRIMASDFVARNEESRARLQKLAARLKDEDFAVSVGEGWTVRDVLGHMAFWDRRITVLLEQ